MFKIRKNWFFIALTIIVMESFLISSSAFTCPSQEALVKLAQELRPTDAKINQQGREIGTNIISHNRGVGIPYEEIDLAIAGAKLIEAGDKQQIGLVTGDQADRAYEIEIYEGESSLLQEAILSLRDTKILQSSPLNPSSGLS